MVESHDELIMEFIDKYGYNRSDEDDDDGGDLSYPGSKSTELKPPYMCPGCLITRIATI
jgi:hypothetical protein